MTASSSDNGLKPDYTFETFVVGASNRFAQAAAFAVAEAPAIAYNPLLIYGGSGLGRDHLLHAIGHYALAAGTAKTVRYVKAADFGNDFNESLRTDSYDSFQRRYSVDILLIDDIQFLENRERVQEELCHTLDALYVARKQIVIGCDRKPTDLAALEERLRSLFEWGLVADITPPDRETRIAVLQRQQSQERLYIPQDVLEFIASMITLSLHELQAALRQVTAFASLNHLQVTVALAARVLSDVRNGDGPLR